MRYEEEDFLLLSGIQHFAFCRRQWALIHVEHQWAENFRTVDGAMMHEKAHDKAADETRGDLLITRGMRIFSPALGVAGECDVLEFRRGKEGIPLKERQGLWKPFPVEYKRGTPKAHNCDKLQLCAQAICLEEMLCCAIPDGALFYGEPRRREPVEFTDQLRKEVQDMIQEMHEFARRGYTPKVRPTKACNACSLRELCLPKLMRGRSAAAYLSRHIEDDL